MFFVALATDYDGTLAADGVVDAEALDSLRSLRKSGRKVILVTGREMSDLALACPDLAIFDLIVAENGATLYDPATKDEQLLAPPASPELVAHLKALGITPLSVGRSIVATWEPNETVVLQAIRELGLELQIIFNKGAVMVLPASVNKASGLHAALNRLGISPYNVAGIGDAENDHAFLRLCGCSVAVDNALETLKAGVDLVTRGARGAGVVELCRMLCETDLTGTGRPLPTPMPALGKTAGGSEIPLDPRAGPLLITGSSGGGKTTTVTTLLERMTELDYQCCVLDPEGDYGAFAAATAIGTAKNSPTVEEILSVLDTPGMSVVCNLLAVPLADRPGFLAKLLPELSFLRSETGRPHWIVLDEAHHLLPSEAKPVTLPRSLPGLVLVTVSPKALSPMLLDAVETVIGVGDQPFEIVAEFCEAAGTPAPPRVTVPEGGAVYYRRGEGQAEAVTIGKPQSLRIRHVRKYAEGELGEDRSFYFRGPEEKLNLRAQNLIIFLQLASGVDDDTWMHHLKRGDYSAWFRSAIKDPDLAEEAARVEADESLSPKASREQIEEQVTRRYTAPATKRGE
ncbi:MULTISPECIES: HAD family hydrolase [Rhodomicrobium]|uniref:HAD-IIB family hydrolase n=1 Tax=Rhodomicrobium TaxID=1068 RepID=UPI000B4BF071|nr:MULTISPECIES: HAD family hydrolase [Rhodomicrobium]